MATELTTPNPDQMSLDELRTHAQSLDTQARQLSRQLRGMHDQDAYDVSNPIVPFINHLAEPIDKQSEDSLRRWITDITPLVANAREYLRSQSTVEPASPADFQLLRQALNGLRKL